MSLPLAPASSPITRGFLAKVCRAFTKEFLTTATGENVKRATLILALFSFNAFWIALALPWFINQGWVLLLAGVAATWSVILFNIASFQRLYSTKEKTQ